MKKILVPLFLLIISFNAYGEWKDVTQVQANDNVYTFYVDFDSIKTNGNVYYWGLRDALKPDQFGDLSLKFLKEVHCNTPLKSRFLSRLYYTQPMGKGSTSTENNKPSEWIFLPPESGGEEQANIVCNYANQ